MKKGTKVLNILLIVLFIATISIGVSFFVIGGGNKNIEIENKNENITIDPESSIYVSLPEENQEISSPLHIEGLARGSWFSEASFEVLLKSSDGQLIAAGNAQAKEDWDKTVEAKQQKLEAAQTILNDNVIKAAQTLTNTLNQQNQSLKETTAKRLSFDAAKHVLKLNGLEVDRIEHSGKTTTQLVVIAGKDPYKGLNPRAAKQNTKECNHR